MFGPGSSCIGGIDIPPGRRYLCLSGILFSARYLPIIEALIKVFEFLWQNVFKPLAEFVGSVFVAVFDNMFKSIGDIIGGLKNIFIGLMDFITGIFHWRLGKKPGKVSSRYSKAYLIRSGAL